MVKAYMVPPQTSEIEECNYLIQEDRTFQEKQPADKAKKEDEEDIGSIRDLFEF